MCQPLITTPQKSQHIWNICICKRIMTISNLITFLSALPSGILQPSKGTRDFRGHSPISFFLWHPVAFGGVSGSVFLLQWHPCDWCCQRTSREGPGLGVFLGVLSFFNSAKATTPWVIILKWLPPHSHFFFFLSIFIFSFQFYEIYLTYITVWA